MIAKRNRKSKRRSAENDRKIGYAVVGLGHIAQEAVLPAFQHATENSRLVALVSSDSEKREALAKQYEVPQTYSYEEFDACLANEEVDAVYIALPNTMHAEYTERAAKAGVHVLCEKPMAISEADCHRMIRACREADVRLMIAYRLHFERANLKAVELVKSGKLGEPKFFESVFSYQVRGGNIRTQADLGGGPVWDIGIYCINATRYLFRAEPYEVFAFSAKSSDPRFREIDETVSAILRFPDERLATFTCSYGSATTGTYRVVGTEGDLCVDNAYEYQGAIEHWLTLEEKTRRRRFSAGDQFAPELLYFSDCVIDGTEPEPSGVEGLADVRIIRAIHESIMTGRPVSVQPVEIHQRPDMAQEIHRPPVKEPELVNVEAPTQE